MAAHINPWAKKAIWNLGGNYAKMWLAFRGHYSRYFVHHNTNLPKLQIVITFIAALDNI